MSGRLAWMMVGLGLLASTAGAQVCDLSELATVPAPGTVTRPLIVDSTAYLAGGGAGIVRVDISNPDQPAVLGADATSGPVRDLTFAYFDDLLVTAEGGAGVGAHTVNPTGTSSTGVTSLGGTAISVAGTSGVFVAGTEEGNVYAFILDDQDRPVIQGSLSLGGEVTQIVVDGATAYCALGSADAVAVVNVSDPSHPALVTSHAVDGAATALARDGQQLYVGVAGVGLVVLDVAGGTVTEADRVTLDTAPTGVLVWNGRVYAVGPTLGVVELDISLGVDVIPIGTLHLPGATGLTLGGDLAYVARAGNGFTIVDVAGCSTAHSSVTVSFVPAAARARGDLGTVWRTDLAIANLTRDAATVNIAYLAKKHDNTNPVNVSLALASGQQLLLGDVFESLFGRDSGNGGLRVTASSRDVKISSRTYNAGGDAGTFGQYIPALGMATAVVSGVPGGLVQLQQDAGFRTNIGLVNLTGTVAEVRIHLFDGDGTELGTVDQALAPYEMNQLDRIYEDVTGGPVDSGFALVEMLTSGGSALAYASVADNQSGDPIYIPSQPLSAGWPFPG